MRIKHFQKKNQGIFIIILGYPWESKRDDYLIILLQSSRKSHHLKYLTFRYLKSHSLNYTLLRLSVRHDSRYLKYGPRLK